MTQTVPDISPLMPMHQDPLLVSYQWYHLVLAITMFCYFSYCWLHNRSFLIDKCQIHNLCLNIYIPWYKGQQYLALPLWEDKPINNKEFTRMPTCSPLINTVLFYSCNTTHIMHAWHHSYIIATAYSSWWLQMSWCLFGTRTSATILMMQTHL